MTNPTDDTKLHSDTLKQLLCKCESELRGTSLDSLQQEVETSQAETSKGPSILQLQNSLFSQYLLSLFYLMRLKVSGKSIEHHPVVTHLCKLRVYLDKMKPLNNKLKYGFDKLVRLYLQSQNKTQTSEETPKSIDNDDKLRFKPNLNDLEMDGVAPMEEAKETNISADTSKKQHSSNKKSADIEPSDGLYHPPRMAPVYYDDKPKQDKKARKQEKDYTSRSFRRDQLITELMEEFSTAPQEKRGADILGHTHAIKANDSVHRRLESKQKYEEDTFVRLPVTKEEKKRAKQMQRGVRTSGLEQLDDFGSIAASLPKIQSSSVTVKKRPSEKLMQSKRSSDTMDSMPAQGKAKRVKLRTAKGQSALQKLMRSD